MPSSKARLVANLASGSTFANAIIDNVTANTFAARFPALGGDLQNTEGSNTVTLRTSGVTAGTYGNTTAIPVITVDAKGRITSATTNSVSGVTGVSYTAANSTITVSTSTVAFSANIQTANSSVQGLIQVVDSVANLSTTVAASANSVKNAYDRAIDANTRASSAQTAATSAYSNAVTYAGTIAATAYSNAVSTASADATSKVATAYSNAVSTASADATSKAATAYSNAVSTASADATTKAATAYTNAVAYAASNTYVNTTFAPKAAPTFTGTAAFADVTISGNLTTSGTTTYINTTNLTVGDNVITLNADLGAAAPTENAGIEINRGTSANVALRWNEALDKWETTVDGTNYLTVATNTDVSTAYSNAIAYSGNAALAYANAVSVAATDASTKAATAYSNATTYAATIAGTAYSNAVAYAAANSYVNTQLGLKASLSGATFSGAVSGITTLAAGNTTITGFANVSTFVKSSYAIATGSLASYDSATGGVYTYYSSGGVVGSYANNTGGQSVLSLDGSAIQIRPSGTTALYAAANGNVGVGTSTPSVKFEVNGALGLTGNPGSIRWLLLSDVTNTYTGTLNIQAGAGSAAYGGGVTMYGHSHASFPGWVKAGISSGSGGKFAVNTWGTGGGTDVFVVDASGNTGVSNTAPTHKLSVNGTAYFGGNTTIAGFANVSSTLQVTGGSTLTGAVTMANTLAVTGSTTTPLLNVGNSSVYSTVSMDVSNNLTLNGWNAVNLNVAGTNEVSIVPTSTTFSSNVGVGSSPSSILYVSGTGTTTPSNTSNMAAGSIFLYNGTAGSNTNGTVGIFGHSAGGLGIASGIGFSRESASDWASQIRFYTHSSNTTAAAITNIDERMRITGAGLVAIGTTSPVSGYPLTVYDSVNGGIVFQNSTNYAGLAQNGNDVYFDIGRGGSAGAIIFRRGSGLSESARIDSSGHFLPGADATYNLGSTSARWNNIYTADAHFSNEGTEGNSVDGTTGNWTLQEGEDFIYMLNNKTGKRYKIKMEEV